jgi:hypothetical protein
MIIEPKIRNNVCLTAHPYGCAEQVREQIEYVKRKGRLSGPKTALIIGSSTKFSIPVTWTKNRTFHVFQRRALLFFSTVLRCISPRCFRLIENIHDLQFFQSIRNFTLDNITD